MLMLNLLDEIINLRKLNEEEPLLIEPLLTYVYLALRGGLFVGLIALSTSSAAMTGSTVLLVALPF